MFIGLTARPLTRKGEGMKKIVLLAVLLMLILSCSEDSTLLKPGNIEKYQKLVYESLTINEKKTLTTDWKDFKVIEGHLVVKNEEMIFKSNNDVSYNILTVDEYEVTNGEILVCVIANTYQDALLGPIISFVNPNLTKIIGFAGRY